MKEEITLLHYPDCNPKNWGVFNNSDCPDNFAFPDFLYRTYRIDSEDYKRVFDILLEVKTKLAELSILPSPRNEIVIFPTIFEISNWNDEIRKSVLGRLEALSLGDLSPYKDK